MSHRNVETLIGRLATDPALRRRFSSDPIGALQDLRGQGYEISLVELEALSATDADAIRRFADALDRRIQRAAGASKPDTAKG
jgi:hypothetical protein